MKTAFKNLIFNIHLWSGLSAGFFIFLICLSGTILTFEQEIHELSHPSENKIIDSKLPKKSISELNQILSEHGEITSLTYRGESLPYIFNIKTSPKGDRGKNFFVDPTTAEIVNNPETSGRSPFMMFNFKLHRWLLGDSESVGKMIVGIATIVMGLLTLSGLYLWWPKNLRMVKNVLKINFKNPKRMLYDLHNTLGFYSLIPLLVMVLTGLCWSFGWYRDALSVVLGAKVFGDRRLEVMEVLPTEKMLSLESIILTVNEKLNYEGVVNIKLDRKENEALLVRKSPNKGLKFTDIVQVNPYTAEIVSEKIFSARSLGDKISSLIRHLHTGEFYGLFSKIIYFLACLVATSLPITGTLMWLNKLKLKKKKKKAL